MKYQITTYNKANYSNPTLETKIADEHSRLMRFSHELGTRMGIRKTGADCDSIAVLTEPIYTGYNEVMALSHRENQGVLELAHGKMDVDSFIKEEERLQIEKDKAESAWKIKHHQLGNAKPSKAPYYTLAFGIILSIIILSFDLLYISTAFQVTGEPFYRSFLMGFGISTAIGVLGVLGSIGIEMIKDKTKRVLAYIGLSLFVSAGLWVICSIRSEYLYELTGKNISPISFLLLNLLALVAFHLTARFIIMPAWAKMRETRELFKKQKEVANLKKEFQIIDNDLQQTVIKKDETKKFKLSVLAYAQSIEEQIQKHFESSLAEFKRAYIEESRLIPNSFSQPPPMLHSFYHNYRITPNLPSHEN